MTQDVGAIKIVPKIGTITSIDATKERVMATKSTNPTIRETSATTFDRGERNLIVTIHHGVIKIRPKGLKSEEVINIAAIYEHAVKARVRGK
jgi:hypothetical protein